jgi:hypothetical protein
MTRYEFIQAELKRFSNKQAELQPFRVAVSDNYNGRDYAYGSHAEQRDYADTTIGYTTSRETAEYLLGEAYDEAFLRNETWLIEQAQAQEEEEEEEAIVLSGIFSTICPICGKLTSGCNCEEEL